KTIHPRLDITKIVAGMSGSPIYLDGKMAGAYAYGWSFGAEPVAGVTPIRAMLDELERPLPKIIDGFRLEPGPSDKRSSASSGKRYTGRLDHYDVREHASALAKQTEASGPAKDAVLRPVATPLLIGGMTSGAIEAAKELFS